MGASRNNWMQQTPLYPEEAPHFEDEPDGGTGHFYPSSAPMHYYQGNPYYGAAPQYYYPPPHGVQGYNSHEYAGRGYPGQIMSPHTGHPLYAQRSHPHYYYD